MAQKLADAVNALDGRMQLARIDSDESPSIAQALQAQQLPAIYGLIGGRPMPIAQGLPSDEELQQICGTILPQLVQVAERSGVAGTAPFVESSVEKSLKRLKTQIKIVPRIILLRVFHLLMSKLIRLL